ncbi:MAG: hypothetical protein WCE75_04915 [Terracidiphilus sp.]
MHGDRTLAGEVLEQVGVLGGEGCGGNPGQAGVVGGEAGVRQAIVGAAGPSLRSWVEYLSGRYTSALTYISDARVRVGDEPILDAVEALASIQFEEPGVHIPRIEALAQRSPHQPVVRGALGYAYAADGQTQKARALLASLKQVKEGDGYRAPYANALIEIGLNQVRPAIESLEESYRGGSMWSLGFLSDPILAPLKDNPDYRTFLRQLSYPAREGTGNPKPL